MNLPDFKELSINGIPLVELSTNGVVLWEKITGGLPSIYQQVEWVQAADGVMAYLDLGFSFDSAATMEIAVENDGYRSQVFGAAENSGKLRCMATLPFADERNGTFYGSKGSAYIDKTHNMLIGKNEFEFSLKKGELRVKRKDISAVGVNTSQAEYSMTSHLLLFAQNYNGAPRYQGTRQVYYFKYYDKTGTLICDLLPCYRKSDGVIGMYDMARQLFLTNVGSGAFTKGADV